jgi:hypothetical protein
MLTRANAIVAALLFGVVFVSYAVSPVSQSADSFWVVPVMLNVLSTGHTSLDGYPQLLREKEYHGVECVTADYRVVSTSGPLGCPAGSHYYYWYPIGTPFVALPLMVAADTAMRILGPPALRLAGAHIGPVARAFLQRDYLASHLLVEVLLSSIITALSSVLLFLTARLYLGVRGAIVIALLFAFGTSAWSTASRALWQHGPAMLMLALALYLLSLAANRPSLLSWTAAPLVLAYFIRPTSSLSLALVGAYVFLHHRERFWKWLLLAAVTAAPFLAYNLYIYHRPLQSYFTLGLFLAPTAANLGHILTAFAGHVLSPSRGLFIFSPFLLFSLAGIWLSFRRHWMTPLVYYLAAALALHWIVISDFLYWTAGHCYGPRLFTDVLPLLLFFLIPALLWLRLDDPRRPISAAFYLCVLVSVFIHYRGAAYWAPYEWNGSQPQVTAEHAWDWRDPQFLRGVFGTVPPPEP